MTIKQFAEKAIQNGYTNNLCEGWDWIKENLQEADGTKSPLKRIPLPTV